MGQQGEFYNGNPALGPGGGSKKRRVGSVDRKDTLFFLQRKWKVKTGKKQKRKDNQNSV